MHLLRFLDGGQGCQFRMTSYDEEHSGPDFSPAYGVQLHDPRLLEYVGAPESACLLTRSPEYWLHLVTALNRSSDVMRVVHDRRPFPTDAMQQVVPTYRVHQAANYMTALGLWRPPTTPGDMGTSATRDMQRLHVVQRLLPGHATVSRERSIMLPVIDCFIEH